MIGLFWFKVAYYSIVSLKITFNTISLILSILALPLCSMGVTLYHTYLSFPDYYLSLYETFCKMNWLWYESDWIFTLMTMAQGSLCASPFFFAIALGKSIINFYKLNLEEKLISSNILYNKKIQYTGKDKIVFDRLPILDDDGLRAEKIRMYNTLPDFVKERVGSVEKFVTLNTQDRERLLDLAWTDDPITRTKQNLNGDFTFTRYLSDQTGIDIQSLSPSLVTESSAVQLIQPVKPACQLSNKNILDFINIDPNWVSNISKKTALSVENLAYDTSWERLLDICFYSDDSIKWTCLGLFSLGAWGHIWTSVYYKAENSGDEVNMVLFKDPMVVTPDEYRLELHLREELKEPYMAYLRQNAELGLDKINETEEFLNRFFKVTHNAWEEILIAYDYVLIYWEELSSWFW